MTSSTIEAGVSISRVSRSNSPLIARDRSQFAFAQLKNKRAQRSLRDELGEARQDISRLRGEISDLQAHADSQHRVHKNLLEMLERKMISALEEVPSW